MGKQKFDRMKKTLSILMLVFIVVPLTAVAVAGDHGSYGGRGGHGYGGGFGGGFGGWGGPGFGWGDPFGFYPPAPYGTAPGSWPVDLMDASVLLTTHTLCRLS